MSCYLKKEKEKKKVDYKFKINLGYVVNLVSEEQTARLGGTGLCFQLLRMLIQKDCKFKTKSKMRTRNIAQW